MTWLLFLALPQSFAAPVQPQSASKGIQCDATQPKCCVLDMSVERCKAAAIAEGKSPEMTSEESQSILGTGPKSLSVMACIAHEKASGHWKSAKDDCQAALKGCTTTCALPTSGGWPPETCENAIAPIMALIEGAKSDSDQAVTESRDTLKALTGDDDAKIDTLLADAKGKLAKREPLDPNAPTSPNTPTSPNAQITPNATSASPRPTTTTPVADASPAPAYPPVVKAPVASGPAAPISTPAPRPPGWGQVVALPAPGAGPTPWPISTPVLGALPVIGPAPVLPSPVAGTPPGGAQVVVTPVDHPGSVAPVARPAPGGDATVVLTPASTGSYARYNVIGSSSVDEGRRAASNPTVASAPVPETNGEVEAHSRKNLFNIVSGGYSSWSVRSHIYSRNEYGE